MANEQRYAPSSTHTQTFAAPARLHVAVTKSDSTTYEGMRAIRIGTGGDIALQDVAGTSITYTVADKEVLQFGAYKILSTGTTASNIVAWF